MLIVALSASGGVAFADVEPPRLAPTPGVGDSAVAAMPEMVAALQRDLGLTREEAVGRMDRSATADRIHHALRSALGPAYAGAWLNEDGTAMTVAVSDARLVGRVRAAGAQPKLVKHRLVDLDAAAQRLLAVARPDSGVSAWFVDYEANKLVVETLPGAQEAGRRLVAAGGVDPAWVRFDTVASRPVPVVNVRAGDDYDTNFSTFCTAGFGVEPIGDTSGTTGFVTVGHCGGDPGSVKIGVDFGAGNVAESTFLDTGPGPDRAWVRLNGAFRAVPEINTRGRGILPVLGSVPAMQYADVCHSGASTGWQCGKVLEFNVMMPLTFTKGLPQPVTRMVTGLTRASFCAEGGDSGGPAVASQQAQGVVVSGIGTCQSHRHGPSEYQPINPILTDFGLRLLTPTSPPPPPAALNIETFVCEPLPIETLDRICRATWAGGVDLASVRWETYQAPRQPIVTTNASTHVTEAIFECDPVPPRDTEYNYQTTLVVTDAVGTRDYQSTIPCGW